jgi:hypothetical protein
VFEGRYSDVSVYFARAYVVLQMLAALLPRRTWTATRWQWSKRKSFLERDKLEFEKNSTARNLRKSSGTLTVNPERAERSESEFQMRPAHELRPLPASRQA